MGGHYKRAKNKEGTQDAQSDRRPRRSAPQRDRREGQKRGAHGQTELSALRGSVQSS